MIGDAFAQEAFGSGSLDSGFTLLSYFNYLIALVFVLGLIALAAYGARRLGLGYPAKVAKRLGQKRVGVEEVTSLDGRRRLVLIRRDDVEHLLLLGPQTELVVETGIRRPTDFAAALADTMPNAGPNQETSRETNRGTGQKTGQETGGFISRLARAGKPAPSDASGTAEKSAEDEGPDQPPSEKPGGNRPEGKKDA